MSSGYAILSKAVSCPPSSWFNLPDKLIDSFRLYNFCPSAQALTHEPWSETHDRGGGSQNPNLLQIWHNEPKVPVSHLLGLGAAMPTCVGVSSHLKLRARLSGCALITRVHIVEGNMALLEWGGTHSCLTSYLTSRSVNSVIYVNFIISLPLPKSTLSPLAVYFSICVFSILSWIGYNICLILPYE